MSSDQQMSARDAALRRLLVERADADGRRQGARNTSTPPSFVRAPGRFRVAAVTGAVLVAVVAGSALVLDAVHVPPSGTSPSRVAPVPARSTAAPPTRTPPPDASAPSVAGLIAKRGAQPRTRAQLHAFVQADPVLAGNSIWEEQAWLKIGCMAEEGFLYDPITEADRDGSSTGDDGLTPAQAVAFQVALYGPQTDEPYDWRTAGCDGLAVHETGQDHAN